MNYHTAKSLQQLSLSLYITRQESSSWEENLFHPSDSKVLNAESINYTDDVIINDVIKRNWTLLLNVSSQVLVICGLYCIMKLSILRIGIKRLFSFSRISKNKYVNLSYNCCDHFCDISQKFIFTYSYKTFIFDNIALTLCDYADNNTCSSLAYFMSFDSGINGAKQNLKSRISKKDTPTSKRQQMNGNIE